MGAMLRESRYILSISFNPQGDVYSRYSLIDRKQMKTNAIHSDRVNVPQIIRERIALVKMQSRETFNVTDLGTWLGPRHLAVYLHDNEYKELKELADADARKQSEEKSTRDTGQA